jgi:phosphatidylinositol-3-phosphatase
MGWRQWLSAALVTIVSTAAPPAIAASADGNTAPPLAHIAIVVMENRSEGSIIGNAAAPYINSLARSYAYLDNYSAVAHPSLPNYLALAGGDTFGITSDCTSCYVPARNLADLLGDAGISGKAYMEDMPRPCFSGSYGGYAQKHNPFAYFDDVRNDPQRCQSEVPYTDLATDLVANSLPAFVWITPNLCHDMHDCGVAAGDRWLADNIPPLLGSPAFTQQPSLLAIVWDEDDGGAANRVPLILAGSQVKPGYVSHLAANHYSLLRTIEAAWGLPWLTANDAAAQPIVDVFQGQPAAS